YSDEWGEPARPQKTTRSVAVEGDLRQTFALVHEIDRLDSSHSAIRQHMHGGDCAADRPQDDVVAAGPLDGDRPRFRIQTVVDALVQRACARPDADLNRSAVEHSS